MSTPAGRRRALAELTRRGVSQRAACRYLGWSRRVAHYRLRQPAKDRELGKRLMSTAQAYPRFGYRRSAAWLDEGLSRVRRLWRQAQSAATASAPAPVRNRHAGAGSDAGEQRLELRLRPRSAGHATHDPVALCARRAYAGMSGDRGCTVAHFARRDLDADPPDAPLRQAAIHPLGSGCGVHCSSGDAVAARSAGRPALHSARQTVAQRLRGELQREAARRMLEPGVVPRSARGAAADRKLAPVLQSSTTAQRSGLPTTRPGRCANPG